MPSKSIALVALIMGGMSLAMMAALVGPAHVVRVSVTDAKAAAVTDTRDDRRLAELSAQVERLSHQLNEVARREDRRGPAGAKTDAPVHRPSAEELAKLRERAAAEEEARALELDRSVDSETRDVQWAPAYEAGVAQSLSEKYPGLKVGELKCARTVCRLSVRHASLKDQSDFVDTFWAALPAFASAEYEPVADDHGSPTTLLHIIRKLD